MIRIELSDVDEARQALRDKGPDAMYDVLAKKGDKYAVLANGVARGDSLSGVAAINYMKSVAAGVGRPMQEIDVDKVRVEMANKYMEVLLKKISKGPIVGQVSQKEVAAFHKETFESLDYPERAWTLSPVFDVIAVENREDYWRHVLSSAGNLTDEFTLSFHTHRMMAMASVVSSAENRLIAKEWISRVESPTGVPDRKCQIFCVRAGNGLPSGRP